MEEVTTFSDGLKIRTGIYSGSFNPVHIGHLALANWLCEYAGLDEVWFMVSPHNPMKDRSTLLDDRLRLEMVKAAIGDYPRFAASDFEFTLPTPSYTIDTLRALGKAYPGREFHLIIGADNWKNIGLWKESDELLRRFPILIYPRKGYEITIPEGYPDIRTVDAPLIEISSTMIRQAWKEGKDLRFFLPPAALAVYLTTCCSSPL